MLQQQPRGRRHLRAIVDGQDAGDCGTLTIEDLDRSAEFVEVNSPPPPHLLFRERLLMVPL